MGESEKSTRIGKQHQIAFKTSKSLRNEPIANLYNRIDNVLRLWV